ncbi:MAG: nucleoside-diphosphate kinase [Candidatus Nomurabacteria bacterium]|jgi:nucleoside-diphosphate kinase|nr:nucleoside-diphosphate kinase [Candidatus Nomurabacteria bacterium]
MTEKANAKDAEKEYEKLVQKTLIVFKPDALQRGIVGELLQRFERVGLKIVGAKMLTPDYDHYHHHYEGISKMITRHGENAFNDLLSFMSSGPVIAMVFEGVEAIEVARKIVGATEPKSADMGTIRGDYSHVSYGYTNSRRIGVANLIHASGSKEEAEQEIKHWFNTGELYDYSVLTEKYSR